MGLRPRRGRRQRARVSDGDRARVAGSREGARARGRRNTRDVAIRNGRLSRLPAWDRTPSDLAGLGYERDPHHLFGILQRVSGWNAEGPPLSRRARAFAERALDFDLPDIV